MQSRFGVGQPGADLVAAQDQRHPVVDAVHRGIGRGGQNHKPIGPIGASLYDDGIDLSGGETQKIVATRTLLDNADIWIFDEPVAAMDPSSEYSFFNTVLEEDDKSKTMIFVSHRLKIASKMNRIIYLENGKIVGIGTHQQLMTGCEKYRRYYVSWLLMEND